MATIGEIAERALAAEPVRGAGAVLAARLAETLPPEQAALLAGRFSTGFLTDLSLHLNADKADHVVRYLPSERSVAISKELAKRGEYDAMAGFVPHLRPEVVHRMIAALDEATVVRVGSRVEDREALDRIVTSLEPERLEGIVRAAAEHDLWDETLRLVRKLDQDSLGELARLAAERDAGFLMKIIIAATGGRPE